MKNLTTKTVRVSIDMELLFDDIAEQLQDDDELDLDFDTIHEKLSEEFSGFFDFSVNVEYDTETKDITAISDASS